jgi:hypothetical protein
MGSNPLSLKKGLISDIIKIYKNAAKVMVCGDKWIGDRGLVDGSI